MNRAVLSDRRVCACPDNGHGEPTETEPTCGVHGMAVIAHACEDCGGTGSVRVHSPEDYGVSFECEQCEHCGGTGVDVEALQAAYRGAVSTLQRYGRHDDDCRSIRPGVGGACDCGFDAARSAIGGQSETSPAVDEKENDRGD